MDPDPDPSDSFHGLEDSDPDSDAAPDAALFVCDLQYAIFCSLTVTFESTFISFFKDEVTK